MTFQNIVRIKNKTIGAGQPAFIIAELGVNHGGDADVAAKMIEAAAAAGVDSVKLQTICADESYITGEPAHNIFKDLWFNKKELERLTRLAEELNLVLFSTPGDFTGLEAMMSVKMPLIKISSGLMTNAPLLERCVKTGLPILVSTGMSFLDEVAQVVKQVEQSGGNQLMILHCTSLYPAPAASLNLAAMKTMAEAFPGCPIGYSDHFDGVAASVAAVAMGAKLIEKHFTLDRGAKGPDHFFSADPAEMKQLVSGIRLAEQMAGSFVKEPSAGEMEQRDRVRRCLVAQRDIAAGEIIVPVMVAFKRPRGGSKGLPPVMFKRILGRRTRVELRRNDLILLESLVEDGAMSHA